MTSENALKAQEEKYFLKTFLRGSITKPVLTWTTSNSGFNVRKMCYAIAFSVSVK